MPAEEHFYGLILAGGRGTRFWPRSRRRNAKQVLRLFGDRSLIQQTVDRLRPVLPPERQWILTNEHVRAEIVNQLPEVPARQILAEPAQRNTAAAIGLAAHILESFDPGAVMGVFPSDHVISNPARFLPFVRQAFLAAAEGEIVVLGIEPRWPETGYGYIEFPENVQRGVMERWPVVSFHEKPNRATAERFLAAGHFSWNAGMFFWRASVVLEALRRYLPKTASLLDSLPPFASLDFGARLAEIFPQCDDISIDYAVLEKVERKFGLAAGDFGWNDVGSWNAVYELLPRDSAANVPRRETIFLESNGNYVDAGGKLVALLGVDDLIVVDTPDALLVARRDQAQRVGELVKLLEKQQREDLL